MIPTVRAVLSWNTPPSTDPNVLNGFGNRLDAHIQLAPAPFSLKCLIESGVLQKDAAILKGLDLQQPLQKVTKGSLAGFVRRNRSQIRAGQGSGSSPAGSSPARYRREKGRSGRGPFRL